MKTGLPVILIGWLPVGRITMFAYVSPFILFAVYCRFIERLQVWMVYPNIRPTSLVKDDPNPAAPRPPRIEYLSTLSRHSAAVNVVRFSPNGKVFHACVVNTVY